ncbi:hypothetical protein [Flavobacterium sp.]|uniref:hypothetical protein n=1 Tax=Flavobacterium sp. TaxID=239 RepID=UPI0028BD3A20|nr:hypothetical protein [Flavobacterium sp.]
MKQFDLHNDPKIESGFKIPENYFESFEERLMQQLPEKDVRVVSLWKRKTTWISAIAAVVTVSLGVWLYTNSQTTELQTTTETYLAYQSDITTEDIAAQLTDADITAFENELGLYGAESEAYVNEYID